MPSPFPNLPSELRGTVHRLMHTSKVLAGNPWNDPTDRDLWVHTPANVDTLGPLPSILILPAFAGTGETFFARGLGDMSIATRLDRLFAAGCPPFVSVMPDTMTSLGGSQYINSSAIGRYADYVMNEIREAVAAQFDLTGDWGVIGRSSGGFGALHLALEYPGEFQVVGCHAGDMGFDLMFLGELGPALKGVQELGGIDGFLRKFWEQRRPSPAQFAAFNLIAMSCAYSPQPGTSPIPAEFPIDFTTGVIDFDVLRSWSQFDPVERIQNTPSQEALRALSLLYIDVGDRDEYQLQYGARRFVSSLEAASIDFIYEEFPGGHRGTAYRYDHSLPILANALTAEN